MLSDSQIETLFKFCKKKYVYYYDVQVELVDHLANAIEIEMANDKKLSFENALQKIYSGFGIMGFSTLVAEKERQAERYNRRLFWRLFKSQFGLPEILGFISLNILFITVFKTFPNFLFWICGVVLLFSFVFYIIRLTQFQKLIKKTEKKFVSLNLSLIGTFQILPFYFFNYFSHSITNIERGLFAFICFSVIISLYIIATIAISQTINSAKKRLIENFPEVFKFA